MKRVSGILVMSAALAVCASAQGGKAVVEKLNRQYGKDLVAKKFFAIEKFYESSIDRDFKWQKQDGSKATLTDLWEGNQLDIASNAKGLSDGPFVFNLKFANWKVAEDKTVVDVTSAGRGEWFTEGKWIPVTFEMKVRQTWQLKGGKWMAVRFQDISRKGILGKPQGHRVKR